MSNYSFEIRSSEDLYKKLVEDYNDLDKNPLSSRHAINCAMTAWHIVDWTFVEFQSKHGYQKIKDFRKSLNSPSLFIMHDIATWSKHLQVSAPKSDLSNTQVHDGDYVQNS